MSDRAPPTRDGIESADTGTPRFLAMLRAARTAPHVLTWAEFEDLYTPMCRHGDAPRGTKERHRKAVIAALKAGKHVPPAVMADYPEIAAREE